MATCRRSPAKGGTALEWVEGETVLSRLVVEDLCLRIGPIAVRCGGIANVSTPREYRMKGYARQLLSESIAFMHAEGYLISALFGIPNFYQKFGFASALMDCETTIATRDAETATARYPVRPFQPEDARALVTLYERRNGQRSGSVLRNPETWREFRRGSQWTDRVGAFVVLDGQEIIGYASYNLDPWRYAIGEVGYADGRAFSTLLAHMAQQAIERRVEHIIVHAPPDDPFLQYCRRYGCEIKLIYRRQAGGMARIIRQTELLEAVQPLLAARLRAAGQEGALGTLVCKTDLGEDALVFGGGPSYTLALPQWMLLQLLLGYRPVEDALFETEARADEALQPLLPVLFPQGYPYIAMSDRF